jgi:hypothetical protein
MTFVSLIKRSKEERFTDVKIVKAEIAR